MRWIEFLKMEDRCVRQEAKVPSGGKPERLLLNFKNRQALLSFDWFWVGTVVAFVK